MEKWTPQQYREYQSKSTKKTNRYNVAPKPDRTWSGIWRGRKQTIVFDSKREMNYCIGLIIQERSGRISGLRFQEPFRLTDGSESEKVQSYYVDYCYFDNGRKKWVAGDVKSEYTAKDQKYINKRKSLKQKFPNIEFEEIVL